jgi:hypothetical protein
MVQVGIVKTTWAGTTGGPGLTQMAFTDVTGADITVGQVQAAVDGVRQFWNAIKAYIPDDITLTVLPTVDMYGELTAVLNGTSTAGTAPTGVGGTDGTSYAMAAGLKCVLHTEDIAWGRRVRGGFYIVPAGSNAFTNTGLASGTATAAIASAGTTMMGAFNTASAQLVVWSKPKTVPEERDGAAHTVSSITASPKTSVLRGRRD